VPEVTTTFEATTTAPAATPPPSDYEALLEMENDWLDTSANNHDGTATGSPTFITPGLVGSYSGHFDGTQSVDIGALPNPGYITVSATIAVLSATSHMLVAADNEAAHPNNRHYALCVNPSDSTHVRFTAFCGGSNFAAAVDPTAYPTDGTPVTFTGVFDGSYVYLYRDGVEVAKTALSGTLQATTAATKIGGAAQEEGALRYLTGDIDDVFIYDYALDPTDIPLLVRHA
jgi:hypothetical protein